MRRIIFSLTILQFSFFTSFSQETKLVIEKGILHNEEYTVLKSDKRIRHGHYIKYNFYGPTVLLIETGNYANGMMDGQWDRYYRGPGVWRYKILQNSLKERSFFKNGKRNGPTTTFYLDTIASKMVTNRYGNRHRADSILLELSLDGLRPRVAGNYTDNNRSGEWISFDFDGNLKQWYDFDTSTLLFDATVKDSLKYNTTRRPLYLGGEAEMFHFLRESFEWDWVANSLRKDSTSATFEFIIKSDGRISTPVLLASNGIRDFKEAIAFTLQKLDGGWLPAVVDGRPVDAKYIIAVDIIATEHQWNVSRFTVNFRTLLD
jgi:antitoxin component YwqK of YwqJK toxin-antitoxin module